MGPAGSHVPGRAVHNLGAVEMELSRPLAQRLGPVAVPADDSACASAVLALTGEQLVHEHPHLVDHNAKGGHLCHPCCVSSSVMAT